MCDSNTTDYRPKSELFYELGMVHTLVKPCVLLAQSIDDIPFDIRRRRFISDEFMPAGTKSFEER